MARGSSHQRQPGLGAGGPESAAKVLRGAAGLARALRARPLLAAVLAAAGVGALLGAVLGGPRRLTPPPPLADELLDEGDEWAPEGAGGLGRMASAEAVLGLLVKVLGNPLVRGYVRRALTRAILRRVAGG